jgi:N-acetylmuramoyl-L-alanine amidase
MANLRKYYRGVKDGGVRHAPFWVLVGASRPSILVEVGYISHPKERRRLFTPKYQALIANGIAEGINSYLNNRREEIDFD